MKESMGGRGFGGMGAWGVSHHAQGHQADCSISSV